jgi:hypothetical protein
MGGQWIDGVSHDPARLAFPDLKILSTPSGSRRGIVIGWFSSEQRRDRRKVRLDRKHLEARTRRFLSGYLTANETRKPQFYRAVEEASKACQPPAEAALQSSELADAQIAEATSDAAMKIVLARERQSVLTEDDRVATFVTDAYATVAVAYHRAAGVYARDSEMQQLGTAAVHLLTMATSYMKIRELSGTRGETRPPAAKSSP